LSGGGSYEPRLKRSESIPRSRCDAGFFNWIPADHPIWCYSDNVRVLRDLQLLFDVNAIESIVEGECDLSKAQEPLRMIYDSKVRGYGHVLADASAEEFRYDRLYRESLTIPLVVALLNASHNRTDQRPVGGFDIPTASGREGVSGKGRFEGCQPGGAGPVNGPFSIAPGSWI
jgi:AraC family transcriptional regulator